MNENNPIGIPITSRPLVGVMNKNGGEKSLGKLVGDQVTQAHVVVQREGVNGWSCDWMDGPMEIKGNNKKVT